MLVPSQLALPLLLPDCWLEELPSILGKPTPHRYQGSVFLETFGTVFGLNLQVRFGYTFKLDFNVLLHKGKGGTPSCLASNPNTQ